MVELRALMPQLFQFPNFERFVYYKAVSFTYIISHLDLLHSCYHHVVTCNVSDSQYNICLMSQECMAHFYF